MKTTHCHCITPVYEDYLRQRAANLYNQYKQSNNDQDYLRSKQILDELNNCIIKEPVDSDKIDWGSAVEVEIHGLKKRTKRFFLDQPIGSLTANQMISCRELIGKQKGDTITTKNGTKLTVTKVSPYHQGGKRYFKFANRKAVRL